MTDYKVPLDVKTFVSKHLGKNWRSVGRHLLADPKDDHFEVECVLDDIDKPDTSLTEKGHQLLRKWQERKGDDATPQALVQALKAESLNNIACKVEKIMIASHSNLKIPAAGELVEQGACHPKQSRTDLAPLHYKRKRLVSHGIGIHWRDLGECLGFKASECDIFALEGTSAYDHCRLMLDEWLKKTDNTFEKLADALHTMGEETLAVELRDLNLKE